jgi:hypothetical protein
LTSSRRMGEMQWFASAASPMLMSLCCADSIDAFFHPMLPGEVEPIKKNLRILYIFSLLARKGRPTLLPYKCSMQRSASTIALHITPILLAQKYLYHFNFLNIFCHSANM